MATREEMSIFLTARDMTSGAFGSLRRNITGVQAAMLALGGGAILQAIRRGVKALDDIDDAAERLGTSSTTFQGLRHTIGQFGGDAEMAERAFDKFSDSIAEAAQQTNFLSRFFQANGVSIRDATGEMRSFDESIELAAQLVAGLNSQQEKLKVATDLFGRHAGPKMVGTLEEIARKGLPAVIKAAQEAGVVLDDSLIKKAGKLDNAFKQAELRLGNLFREMAVALAPDIIKVFETIAAGLEKLKQHARLTDIAAKLRGDLAGVAMTAQDLAEAIALARSKGSPVDPSWIEELKRLQHEEEKVAKIIVRPTVMPLHEDFEKQTKAIEKKTEAMNIDIRTLGMEAGAVEKLKAEQELLNVMQENQIAMTPRYAQAIADVANKAGVAANALQQARFQWEGINDAARFAGTQAITLIEDFFDRTKSRADIARNALKAFANQLLQALLTGEGAPAKILGTASKTGGTGGLFGQLASAFFGQSGINTGQIAPGGVGIVGVGPFGSAKGNVFSRGGLVPFAKGGIVGGPTIFPFANGAGLMGEAGPEAVMPLRRGPDGKLGVEGGGGSNVQVNINNYSGQNVSQSERQGDGGMRIIDIVVGKVVEQIGSGGADKAMRGRFGLQPSGIRR